MIAIHKFGSGKRIDAINVKQVQFFEEWCSVSQVFSITYFAHGMCLE